jgi:hypothetical protein
MAVARDPRLEAARDAEHLRVSLAARTRRIFFMVLLATLAAGAVLGAVVWWVWFGGR